MKQYTTLNISKALSTHLRTFPGSGTPVSLVKVALVHALGLIQGWKPQLAASLGKCVCACWRRFPEV